MSRVNSAIRPSPAMVDISTESYTHEGGLWLGCFWFHYPYQKCEGKEECKFSESHSNFRKTNFGKRQFCAKSHRPIKYCNNFRICKNFSISNKPGTYPTDKLVNIWGTAWAGSLPGSLPAKNEIFAVCCSGPSGTLSLSLIASDRRLEYDLTWIFWIPGNAGRVLLVIIIFQVHLVWEGFV